MHHVIFPVRHFIINTYFYFETNQGLLYDIPAYNEYDKTLKNAPQLIQFYLKSMNKTVKQLLFCND